MTDNNTQKEKRQPVQSAEKAGARPGMQNRRKRPAAQEKAPTEQNRIADKEKKNLGTQKRTQAARSAAKSENTVQEQKKRQLSAGKSSRQTGTAMQTDAKNVSDLRRSPSRRAVKRTPVRIMPLGGLNEIGKNMTLYECGQDMFIVD